MSAALSADADPNCASRIETFAGALSHLQKAMDLMDSVHAPPAIGARIKEAIDAVEAYILPQKEQPTT